MIRRYVVPCVLILTVALGAGGVSYAGSTDTRHKASCGFQVVIHLSNQVIPNPDFQRFIASLALQEVGSAVTSGIYGKVATKERVNTATFSQSVAWRPSPGLGTFVLTVTDPVPRQAIRLANATCDEMVSTIKANRTAAIESQIKVIQKRLDVFQKDVAKLIKLPRNKRTTAQNTSFATLSDSILFNSKLIANLRSLPPDEISVLSRAVGAAATKTGSLSKNLLIGLVGGLLACFLYILVLEIIAERRTALR